LFDQSRAVTDGLVDLDIDIVGIDFSIDVHIVLIRIVFDDCRFGFGYGRARNRDYGFGLDHGGVVGRVIGVAAGRQRKRGRTGEQEGKFLHRTSPWGDAVETRRSRKAFPKTAKKRQGVQATGLHALSDCIRTGPE
jgi:hypothetical protein